MSIVSWWRGKRTAKPYEDCYIEFDGSGYYLWSRYPLACLKRCASVQEAKEHYAKIQACPPRIIEIDK